ncbi:class I SAM-dependent methyltransferase [Segniliparus rugosus]|uniref:Methyltransferase type 11 domain-containing protein n=1 Tax=Segniliparus rugosus (strain ATCC BAA-974 / DSM 45345 / CCUG 50838 / CIP 108380 / JCM 13579 / CDC 945) TaxID=679197 RepID=E5XU52_SEGRC|nr:class I SAM-dependent methyltransferase [Segniliparus rugosus]EFV12115.1 hypothetical protein HMPREF9336_03024 [Segniliparus rugosus ATCC BAA-974]
MTERWNTNIHYQRLMVRAVPETARRVLDVGCGVGTLVPEVRAKAPGALIVGVDLHEESLRIARAEHPGPDLAFVRADVLAAPLRDESFDAILSSATAHHLPLEAALRRMAALLRPGGRLVVVALTRERLPAALLWGLVGAVAYRWHTWARGRRKWEHPSPLADPALSYRQVEATVQRVLPGARVRRLAMWRYAVTWTKP